MSNKIKDYILVDDIAYYINTGRNNDLFVDTKQLNKMVSELHAMSKIHCKVYVQFLDLHLPAGGFTKNNRILTAFLRALKRSLKKQYGFLRIGYTWVREQNSPTPQQHYHVVLMLDGSKVNSSYKLNILIGELWEKMTAGTMGYLKNCFYNLRRGVFKGFADVVFRMSYHAKAHPVYMKPAKTRRYGISKIKFEDKKKR